MAKKKSTRRVKKSTRRSFTARSTRTKSKPTSRRPAVRKELEDDPRRRYQELMEDRQYGSPPEANLAELRQLAMARARGAPVAAMELPPPTPVTPGGSNWIQLGPLAIPKGQTYSAARVIVTGRVTDIVPDPTNPMTIYVATARGGIWKTTDGGVTWAPMSDNAISLQIGALDISASSPQTLYAGTGEGNVYYYALNFPLDSINVSYGGSGILKSTTGGTNWTTQGGGVGGLFTGNCFYRVKVHPTNPNTVFAATNIGLYRTTNGGTNWVPMTGGLPPISATVLAATDVMFDPVTPTTAYVAFWGSGIYKTTNATAANPSWTLLAGGLPTTTLGRIAIAVSRTAPQNVYALIADNADAFKGFYVSTNGGTNWTSVAAAAGVVSVYGAYTLNVAVDISTPNVVYLSGVSLYKAVNTAGTWAVTQIGAAIHPDNHAFASHPTNHLIIYAGSDGGIYKSPDAGATWDDSINEGLCITQFEFFDQHPTSASFIIGGTQDNGTEQFRNSPAFYHSADGDGGSAGVDQTAPRNVIHTYYGASPERSTQGGNFGTYNSISAGIVGAALFYPPLTYDQANSQNVAFGTDRINLDTAQGTGSWPTKILLPGISGRVSALYFNGTVIYAGTTSGQVYRAAKGINWPTNATLISAPPLPSRWIWAITTAPGNINTVLLAMAGFGTPHVWHGAVPTAGVATWTDISGTGATSVPDVPCNAMCVDPANPNTYYLGTDIGVFRTVNGNAAVPNWNLFNDGLPNTAIYDLQLHAPTRLLRAATHGRGLWERKLDALAMSDVDIYVRDHLMDTARVLPTPVPATATYDDPLQQVAVGSSLWWWMCADIKVDSPAATTHTFQMPVAAVDYLAFETVLANRDPQKTVTNRVYVQIHNRGVQAASNVRVKLLFCDASPGVPNLPANFWSAWPDAWTQNPWFSVGPAKTIPSISPTRPEILEWDWVPPASASQHFCMLMVCDCASDPIPAANKVFNIGTLVPNEKRVGQRNLHLIDPLPSPWSMIYIPAAIGAGDVLQLLPPPSGWSVGVLLPKAVKVKCEGLKAAKLTKAQADGLQKLARDGQQTLAADGLRTLDFKLYDPAGFQLCALDKTTTISNVPETKGFYLLLNFTPSSKATAGQFTVIQRSGEQIVGGNTFVLEPESNKQR
jgi:photosystem II stability/assembly factor-like uncharacterized protein